MAEKAATQDWLMANPAFRAELSVVTATSVARQFGIRPPPDAAQAEPPDWPRLLFCASLLQDSARGDCQDAALRITQACISDPSTGMAERDAAATILAAMANRPAIRLAEERDLVSPGITARLGVAQRIEWTRNALANAVTTLDGSQIEANRFQQRFWDAATSAHWVSASAPTSAGKSYIVLRWVFDILRSGADVNVVYVVPTRALVQQVEADIRELRSSLGLAGVNVSSLPLRSALRPGRNVLVFTQERLHHFLSALDEVPQLAAMVVDEAHKVGDRHRGILLQDVVERVVSERPSVRVIFASPLTDNPESLLADAPDSVRQVPVSSDDVTVNQNLLWVSQEPGEPRRWSVRLCAADGLRLLGTLELPHRPTAVSKRLSFVASAMGGSGGNLVYVNGAADAEKTAWQLYYLAGEAADVGPDDRGIADLAELARKAVHPRYSLATVLRRRVAFHYGNMPLLIRAEIERLFRAGEIRFLVCTSTLIEGVNLPCRTIFLRGPQKGRGRAMEPADLWNLAGRAGRWGKEFQGNVVCVDAGDDRVWHGRTPTARAKYTIRRTADEVLANPAEMTRYLEEGTPRAVAVKRPELEYMASYLVATTIRAGGVRQTSWAKRLGAGALESLEQVVSSVRDGLSVRPSTVLRNPGISPIAMDSLLAYMRGREGPLEELIPVTPEDPDARSSYIRLLGRVNRGLAPVFGNTKRVAQLAILVVKWMQGQPLARIIADRVKRASEGGAGDDTLPATIRGVMADVEEVARFQAPKYLSCYMDVLRQHLQEMGREDLLPRTFDINVYLEYGVSGGTQLSLMGLGLSRTSAIAVAEYIEEDSLSEDLCVAWLRRGEWRDMDLPVLVKREIDHALRVA